jgi:Flp pilus assembly protein TadD
VETGWVLGQAESCRELGRLHAANGRKHEALVHYRDAYDLLAAWRPVSIFARWLSASPSCRRDPDESGARASRRVLTPEMRPAGVVFRNGRSQDRAGRLDEAMASYQQAAQLAETSRARRAGGGIAATRGRPSPAQ